MKMKILEEKDDYIIVTKDNLEDEFEAWYQAECYIKNPLRCTACGGGGPIFYNEIKKYLEENKHG